MFYARLSVQRRTRFEGGFGRRGKRETTIQEGVIMTFGMTFSFLPPLFSFLSL